jgi:predicted nucleic acid-binding Zn ribbon protein
MKSVGDLLRQLLRERGWTSGNPYDPVFAGWAKIAGDALSSHARLIDIQNGILLIEVDHPGWLQLAQLRKDSLLAEARRAAPLAGIEGMRFRVGVPEPPR